MNFYFHNPGGREWVDGCDERARWVDTINSYRFRPIKFELRRQWNGDINFESATPTKLFDYHTVEATVDVPALGRTLYEADVATHLGVNQKQQRISLKEKR